jgi:hypothetical protein
MAGAPLAGAQRTFHCTSEAGAGRERDSGGIGSFASYKRFERQTGHEPLFVCSRPLPAAVVEYQAAGSCSARSTLGSLEVQMDR